MPKDQVLIRLNVAVFSMMVGVGAMMAILPDKALSLAGSNAPVGYFASAFAVPYILLQVPIGSLADRYGFRVLLSLGYAVCAFAGLAYWVSQTFAFVLMARIIQGTGEAPVWALAPAWLSLRSPANKGRIIGAYNAVLHLGLTVGPFAGLLAYGLIGRDHVFLLYSILCAVGALAICTIRETKTYSTTKQWSLGGLGSLIGIRGAFPAFLGIVLYGAGYGSLLTVIPASLIFDQGFSQWEIALFFSSFYIAIGLAQLVIGPLSDRLGRRAFMGSGLLGAALSFSLASWASGLAATASLALAGLGLGIYCVSSMAFLNDMAPDELKGTISGAYYLLWGIGFFFGPPLLGKLRSLWSPSIMYWSFALVLVCASLPILLTHPTDDSVKGGSAKCQSQT